MTTWNDIRQAIEKKAAPKAPASPDAFWSDFQARARLTVQDAPVRASSRILWASAALAGSAALLLLAALPFFWASDSMADSVQVTSLEVGAPHSGTMILTVTSENGKDKGAIIWVSGLEESNESTL